MSENYIEKYQADKTEFLDAVKQQLKAKTMAHMETLKQAIGSTIIKSEKVEETS